MKKGNNSKNKQQFKKVKDTILRYLHIGIYVKISVSLCQTMKSVEWPQTNKHTYRVKTELI